MIVVVPMAGRGSRFDGKKYQMPKPLIPVLGKPMIEWALRSLDGLDVRKIIFVALKEHEEKYNLSKFLAGIVSSRMELVTIPDVTEGQLCTVLEAKHHFHDNEDILVACSDTWVISDMATNIQKMSPSTYGLISVANLPGDRWSFARTDESGSVVEVAEKVRISEHASTGLYYFSNCAAFLSAAQKIIINQEKTRGEYFVIPVYQKMLNQGLRVELSHASQVWDMGTPDSLEAFQKEFGKQTLLQS